MGIFSKSRKEADSGSALPLVHKGFEFEATPNSGKIALFSDEGQLFINRVREKIDEVYDITEQTSIEELKSKINEINKNKLDFRVELKYVLLPFRIRGFHFLTKLNVNLWNTEAILSDKEELINGIRATLVRDLSLTHRTSTKEIMDYLTQLNNLSKDLMLDMSDAKASFDYKGFDFVMYFKLGYGYLNLLIKDQELVTQAGRRYVDEKLSIGDNLTVEEIQSQIMSRRKEDETWILAIEIYPIPFSHQGYNFIIKVLLNSDMAESSFSTPRDVFIGIFKEAIDQVIGTSKPTSVEEMIIAITSINGSLEDIWLELAE
jgi:hypothetical protein